MNQYKVVAFDCDGVMFDTRNANDAYYNSILAHFQMPPMTPEQAAYAHMHTVAEAITHLFADPNLRAAADAHRKARSYLPFMRLMVIEPHLRPLLEKIRTTHATAIATNRTDTIGQVLNDFELKQYFDLVVSALDVERPKPFPDQLHKIIDHFNIKPAQLLYIGDSQVDEAAARAAGVVFAAFDNPGLSAQYHVKTLNEIESILD